MPTLYLVRHARPAATWGEDPDPGLDARGHEQAKATAEQLASLGDVALLTSPLRRCRETALPLEHHWQRSAETCLTVAEIPSPPLDLQARSEWLATAMRGTWSEMQATAPKGSPDFLAWRQTLIDTLLQQPRDAVIFTHFIAINVAVAAARGIDHVVCFRPDHASVTRIEVAQNSLRIVDLGREAETLVLTR
jgi:broad specificity phosphatase PhoE